MVTFLNSLTRACLMLSFFIVTVNSMEKTSTQKTTYAPLTYCVARVCNDPDNIYSKPKSYILCSGTADKIYEIPASKKNTALFSLHTRYPKKTLEDSKVVHIGCLEDFQKTTSQQHADNRLSLIKNISKMSDPFAALETFSILANFLITQECAHEVIVPLYQEIHNLFPGVYRSTAGFKREQARILDLHAIHNHIIIFLQNNEPETSRIEIFVTFLECLAISPTYPSREKARRDSVTLYPHLAKKLGEEGKYSEAYAYYKKASNQTIIPAIALKANGKLLHYIDSNDKNSCYPKRLFGEVDDFGSLFEDGNFIDSKYIKY